MPFLFILFVIFAVIAVIVAIIGGLIRASGGRTAKEDSVGTWIGAGVVLLIGVLFLIFGSFVMVGTQDVGVKTSFGHPDGKLSNGIHFKAPWDKVTRLDDAVQTDAYASNQNGSTQEGAQNGCVNVRIARQATACVNVTVRWQIPEVNGDVDYLFRNFKSNDNIRNNLLHRDLQSAVNVAFAHYDPLGLNADGQSTQASTSQLSTDVLNELRAEVPQLQFKQVIIPNFYFDSATQQRLNQLQLQVAQTRIQQQAEQTAAAQARANKILAASVSNDPGVLQSKCLDILSESINKGIALPAGFSCFGGTNTAIAVGGSKK